MEKYRELYNSITNPLDDDTVISDLISAYAEQKNIYSYLTKVHVDDKEYKGQYYPQIKDKLYAKLFKIWKENVLSLTDRQVDWLIQHSSSVEEDYHQLRTYLKTVPDIKTKQEFMELVYKDENNLIEKYGWQSLGKYSGWTHISSRYLTARKEAGFEIEHRLYLNTESIDTEAVASFFIDKCMEKKIPFYFKYDEYGNRDDTIVIYSDTEHLEQYITILRELKKENVELFSRTHQPPILTGKIDNWIGYGAEPQVLPNGERTSFNEVRSKAIEKGIKSAVSNWIYDHQNDLINYNGNRITLSEYLTIKITEKIITSYKDDIDRYAEKGMVQQFYDIYGLVPNDFIKGNLKQVIEHYAKQNIATVIASRKNNKTLDKKINIPTRDGKKIGIYDSDFDTIFRKVTKQIIKHDPNFKKTVKDAIVRESKTMGIDTDKYCFDIASRDKLLTYQEPVNKQQDNRSSSKDGYVVDVSTICDKLNPALMERKLRYPNGVETSAVQYIQEYFYPFITEDGFFTVKNGARITYRQFIEEFVIYIGLTKCNGDVAGLIEATTKKNQGLITINNGTESISFHPVEITNYLNPALMERKLRYPNGTETSAVQYIQEYFSPYIPENGMIILKNGHDIPVKQFIEEFVMFEGQTKYNGDIARLMEATTRSNHGNVFFDRKKEYQKQKELKTMLSDSQAQTITDSGIKR